MTETNNLNDKVQKTSDDFDKLHHENKELEKEYDRQKEKLKEARMGVKEQAETLAIQERMFDQVTAWLREDVALERMKMLDE